MFVVAVIYETVNTTGPSNNGTRLYRWYVKCVATWISFSLEVLWSNEAFMDVNCIRIQLCDVLKYFSAKPGFERANGAMIITLRVINLLEHSHYCFYKSPIVLGYNNHIYFTIVVQYFQHFLFWRPGLRLNKRTLFPSYGDSHVKGKNWRSL